MAKKYYSSGELMEAVKALDYKKKYEVLKAFYLLMIDEGFTGDDSMMCARFRESFSLIYPLLDESSFVPLHWAVNDMDNALYEIDIHDPGTFMGIAGVLAKYIND